MYRLYWVREGKPTRCSKLLDYRPKQILINKILEANPGLMCQLLIIKQ